MGGYEGILFMNHSKFMEINDLNNKLFCWTYVPNMCHPMPFSTSLHLCIRCYIWRFASSRPPQCMCGHCVRYSQSFKIECSKLAIVNLKLITLKGVFTSQNFLLQVTKGDPFCPSLCVSSNNHLLVISSLNCMHIIKIHAFIWTWS